METKDTLTPSRDLDARIARLLGLTMSMLVTLPAYSTDMNAAAELLNHFYCKGLRAYDNGNGKKAWACDWATEHHLGSVDEWGDTPAMAICKAFMASKGKAI